MLYEYSGPLDIPVFYIATSEGALMLAPTNRRRGGPLVFTNPARLRAFLRYYIQRWRALPEPRACSVPMSLDVFWQRIAADSPPDLVLLIDPRPPVLPGDDLDSDFLPLSQ